MRKANIFQGVIHYTSKKAAAKKTAKTNKSTLKVPRIKEGDCVRVTTGRYKGKVGKINNVQPDVAAVLYRAKLYDPTTGREFGESIGCVGIWLSRRQLEIMPKGTITHIKEFLYSYSLTIVKGATGLYVGCQYISTAKMDKVLAAMGKPTSKDKQPHTVATTTYDRPRKANVVDLPKANRKRRV